MDLANQAAPRSNSELISGMSHRRRTAPFQNKGMRHPTATPTHRYQYGMPEWCHESVPAMSEKNDGLRHPPNKNKTTLNRK
jgi:hypothetical protein